MLEGVCFNSVLSLSIELGSSAMTSSTDDFRASFPFVIPSSLIIVFKLSSKTIESKSLSSATAPAIGQRRGWRPNDWAGVAGSFGPLVINTFLKSRVH